jgi:hypothetical protein
MTTQIRSALTWVRERPSVLRRRHAAIEAAAYLADELEVNADAIDRYIAGHPFEDLRRALRLRSWQDRSRRQSIEAWFSGDGDDLVSELARVYGALGGTKANGAPPPNPTALRELASRLRSSAY